MCICMCLGVLCVCVCVYARTCKYSRLHLCVCDDQNVCVCVCVCVLGTCVVEEGGDEGAVLEEGVAGGDVLKVAFLEQRVLKHHGLHL